MLAYKSKILSYEDKMLAYDNKTLAYENLKVNDGDKKLTYHYFTLAY